MGRRNARICSICKEDHALLEKREPDGDVCICDRCRESVARDNFIWICLSCRKVYLESKQLFLERERDPDTRRYYRDVIAECVIHGLETCLQCSAERAYHRAGRESELICC